MYSLEDQLNSSEVSPDLDLLVPGALSCIGSSSVVSPLHDMMPKAEYCEEEERLSHGTRLKLTLGAVARGRTAIEFRLSNQSRAVLIC
ncbi:hypothetical protein N7456_005165 [Penicillium angulare]|uniref:Uncharacterized protein n=1 Tax=Penicillium angulare TaxID=116970 RepID=A0A9W9FXX9_9EURO|nr:hypothetical protein N7456_005165 [Penicillium angulare]